MFLRRCSLIVAIVTISCYTFTAYSMPSSLQVDIHQALNDEDFEQAEKLIEQNAGVNLNFLVGEQSKTSPLGLLVRKAIGYTTSKGKKRLFNMIRFLRIHGASPTKPGITVTAYSRTKIESPLEFIHDCLRECSDLETQNLIFEVCQELSLPLQIT